MTSNIHILQIWVLPSGHFSVEKPGLRRTKYALRNPLVPNFKWTINILFKVLLDISLNPSHISASILNFLLNKYLCGPHLTNILVRIYSEQFIKLDGVGPVDNKHSTDKFHHFVQKEKEKLTHDIWHLTCDMQHMTHNMWHVTCCGGWTFSQNVSSLALQVCYLWYFEDLEENADWLN